MAWKPLLWVALHPNCFIWPFRRWFGFKRWFCLQMAVKDRESEPRTENAWRKPFSRWVAGLCKIKAKGLRKLNLIGIFICFWLKMVSPRQSPSGPNLLTNLPFGNRNRALSAWFPTTCHKASRVSLTPDWPSPSLWPEAKARAKANRSICVWTSSSELDGDIELELVSRRWRHLAKSLTSRRKWSRASYILGEWRGTSHSTRIYDAREWACERPHTIKINIRGRSAAPNR